MMKGAVPLMESGEVNNHRRDPAPLASNRL
jgi:hypothetical protein